MDPHDQISPFWLQMVGYFKSLLSVKKSATPDSRATLTEGDICWAFLEMQPVEIALVNRCVTMKFRRVNEISSSQQNVLVFFSSSCRNFVESTKFR